MHQPVYTGSIQSNKGIDRPVFQISVFSTTSQGGFDLSNTYLLEKKYDWKGICVEPLPDYHARLIGVRPNSICINKAVFSESNLFLDFNVADCSLLSGIVNYIDRHADTIEKGKKIIVETITLYDLLKQNNAPSFIDYLSLDTEGTEFEILKSNNYDEYNFGIIHLEHNFIEPKRTQMKDFLVSKGYIHKRQNYWDDEYIHNSLFF